MTSQVPNERLVHLGVGVGLHVGMCVVTKMIILNSLRKEMLVMIAVSVSYFGFVTFLVHLTKLTVLCFYTINPDWCGIHGCAGCGSSIGHLVQEALDALPSEQEPPTIQSIDGEETVLANENYDHEKEIVVEDVNSEEGGSFMVTNDAYLGPQNSAVGSGEQTQQVVQRLPSDDTSLGMCDVTCW